MTIDSNEHEKVPPSGEAVLDVAAIARRTLLHPGDELVGVLLLTVAITPQGKVQCSVLTTPRRNHDRLLETMRDYLRGPEGLTEFIGGPPDAP